MRKYIEESKFKYAMKWRVKLKYEKLMRNITSQCLQM